MKRLILMMGVPGSGKSTIARAIATDFDEHRADYENKAVIFSTDEFWGDPYVWNTDKVSIAHNWNQKRTRDALHSGIDCVIVDNTNLTYRARAPYIDMAQEYGYNVEVIQLHVPLKTAIDRQINRPPDRQIPEDVIVNMYKGMERLV